MRSSATLLALALLSLPARAVACELPTWFQVDKSDLECPDGREDKLHLLVTLADTYIAHPAADEEQLAAKRLERLQEKRGEISFQVEYLAEDLAPEVLEIPVEDVLANRMRVEASLPFADLAKRKAIRSIHVTFPPESLFCGDTLVGEETTLDVPVVDDTGKLVVSCLEPEKQDASRPLDWHISAAPADDDAEDDPGVALDFDFNKTWGYAFHIDDKSQSWSSNLWRVKVEGDGVTNDADFYDSVTADLSWSRNRSYLGGTRKPVTAYWWGAYLRPETTFSDDTRDYVFGARVEVLANLKTLIGTDVGRGTRPYLALGIERVDPDKREDGTVPENYERATGDFLWKFSPFRLDRIRVEASWAAKYILDKDDLAALGLDDRLQDKLEISVGLDVTGKREFLPFLKYTRGSEAPRFDVVEEVLFGLLWNRLAPGELQQ